MIVDTVLGKTTMLAVLAAVLAAGCGAQHRAAEQPSNREWAANARGVVDQLRGDIVAVAGFDRFAAARKGLDDDSELYGLLVAYTDFGGCRHMTAAVGAEPPGQTRVVRLLRGACAFLGRAEGLFTRAVKERKPSLLVGATREATAAVPALD